MVEIIKAEKIFDGTTWLTNHAIVIEDGSILRTTPTSNIKTPITKHYPNCKIIPAFIDVQIYGAGGRLFAVQPNAESLNSLYDYCVQGGAHYFLPTVATNTYNTIYKCIDAIRDYWDKSGKGCLGLHIEGPWINAAKRGVHLSQLIHAPTFKQVEEVLAYGEGVIKMITLAPEVCTDSVISLIQSHHIIISAGHSNATYQEAENAFDKGIKVCTHLFNAMSAFNHRAPGLAGAILNHHSVMASIIADGYHIDFSAINLAKKLMGNRLFLITDAVTETSDGYYPHKKVGEKYESDGVLSGSALTMMKSVKNCVEKVGIPLDEAIRMASFYPAMVLGLDRSFGKLESGYASSFLVINDEFDVIDHYFV